MRSPALADPSHAYTPLIAGLGQGTLRSDPQGNYHILMIERPEAQQNLSAYVWSQSQAWLRFFFGLAQRRRTGLVVSGR